MNKGKILNFIPYIFILIFAATTAYFFIRSLDKPSQTSKTTTIKPTITASISPTTTNQTENSTLVYTKPAASSKRPSNPAEVYIVGSGETLSMVGEKLDINWQIIASVNNISNADNVQAEQILIIPTLDENLKKLVVAFKIDDTQSQNLQKQAAHNQDIIYLDPVLTAKSDTPPIYGITNQDTFNLESPTNDNSAIVIVTHEDKIYEIQLSQPVNKGKGGIWAISKIFPR